jgi:subtilisin family serine protease
MALQVKVLGCTGSGTYEGVIAGIDWTVTDAKKRGRPSVANMSLGGGKSTIVNAAVAGTSLFPFISLHFVIFYLINLK